MSIDRELREAGGMAMADPEAEDITFTTRTASSLFLGYAVVAGDCYCRRCRARERYDRAHIRRRPIMATRAHSAS